MSIFAYVVSASLLLAIMAASSKEDSCNPNIMPSLGSQQNQPAASESPQHQFFHRGSGRRDTAQCA